VVPSPASAPQLATHLLEARYGIRTTGKLLGGHRAAATTTIIYTNVTSPDPEGVRSPLDREE